MLIAFYYIILSIIFAALLHRDLCETIHRDWFTLTHSDKDYRTETSCFTHLSFDHMFVDKQLSRLVVTVNHATPP